MEYNYVRLYENVKKRYDSKFDKLNSIDVIFQNIIFDI